MRLTHQIPLSRTTPISIEREFAVFHRDGTPLRTHETAEVIGRFRQALAGAPQQTEVVPEIAPNTLEVKLCFSSIGRLGSDLQAVYQRIAWAIKQADVWMIGTSQPRSVDFSADDFIHFFTLDVFRGSPRFFGPSNSIHAHIGFSTTEDGVALYNAGNRTAPFTQAVSQCSIIDGLQRGRAHFVRGVLKSMPMEVVVPWAIGAMTDFDSGVERARAATEQLIRAFSPALVAELARRHPDFITMDGRLLKITPDKIYHPVRLRPDKMAPERGLLGSVEVRQIDGQANLHSDLAQLEFMLGLLAYELTHNKGSSIQPGEAAQLIRDIYAIPEGGLAAIHWNGIRNPATARDCAAEGLAAIGVPSGYLSRLPLDGGAAEFATVSGLNPVQIIERNHQRFVEEALQGAND